MIKLISYKKIEGPFKIGEVVVQYYELTMLCDVCIQKNDNGIWIRLPRAQKQNKIWYNVNHWEGKAVSDNFQLEVMLELKKLHPEAWEYRKYPERKKYFKERKKTINVPGKARNQSKFGKPWNTKPSPTISR